MTPLESELRAEIDDLRESLTAAEHQLGSIEHPVPLKYAPCYKWKCLRCYKFVPAWTLNRDGERICVKCGSLISPIKTFMVTSK